MRRTCAQRGETVNGRMSFSQYRATDCSFFALILIVFESIIVKAATAWFPMEAWTVSCTAAVTAIVMVRWGPWCAIHAAIGGIVTVLVSRGTGTQFLIYGIGNLAALAVWPLEKRWGWEKLKENVLLNFLFAFLVLLAMQAGRMAVALVLGTKAEELLLFITTDAVSYIFTLTIVWIASRLDGILEDQKHYLTRINDPKNREGGIS